MSLSGLTREKRKFELSKRKVYEVIQSLEKSRSSLASVSSRVKEAYSVNEVPGDNNYLNQILNSQKDLIHFIQTTILSNINQEIRRIEEEIESLFDES